LLLEDGPAVRCGIEPSRLELPPFSQPMVHGASWLLGLHLVEHVTDFAEKTGVLSR
jgi:hypothetical protein